MFLCQSVLCMVAILLATSRAVPTKGETSDIKIPDECKGQRFCDIKPEGYDQLVARFDSLVPDYLIKYHAEKAAAYDLQQRTGTVETESQNCKEYIQPRFIYLYFGNKSNNKEFDIVVQNEKFTQRFDEVKCGDPRENSEAECFQDLKLNISEYKTTCETIYSNRTLYVLNKDKQRPGIVGREIRLSVACSCTVTRK